MNRRLLLVAGLILAGAGCTSDVPHSNPYDPQSPTTAQAKSRLVGRVSLEGKGDADDRSGVRVALTALGLESSTVADGSWTLDQVPPGTWSLEVSKEGYRTGTIYPVVVTLDQGGAEVQVPAIGLQRSRGSVRGKALLEGEDVSAGISVSLSNGAGSGQTDATGEFVLSGIASGTYEVSYSKVAFRDVRVGNVVVAPDGTTVLAPVTLSSNPGSLSGRVIVRGAANSDGVLVTADGMTLGGHHNVVQVTTAADPSGQKPDGSFTLSNVAAGLYNVIFTKDNYITEQVSVAVTPEKESVLAPVTMTGAVGALTGTATLAGALDHSGIEVSLTPQPTTANPNPSVAAAAITDSAGTWRLEGLPVGNYDLLYKKRPGYQDKTGTATVVRDAVVSAGAVVLAEIPGEIRGRVLLEGFAAGADLSGTSVRLDGHPAVTTDAQGNYSVTGSGGAHLLHVTRTGYTEAKVQVAIAAGDILTLDDVTLAKARGSVFGILAVEERSDASGVLVTLSSATEPSFTALTDSRGAFRFSGVPVGTWQLDASLPNYLGIPTATATVAANLDTEAPSATAPAASRTLSLRRDAAILGTVHYSAGSDQSGVNADLSGADVNGVVVHLTARSDVSGAFSFTGLPPGGYRLSLALQDYEAADLGSVALAAGQTVTLGAASLSRSRGDAAGQFLLTGASSHDNIKVTLSGTGAIAGTTVSVLTDPLGNFSAAGLPVGTYSVAATKAPDWASQTGSLTVTRNAVGQLVGSPLSLTVISTASVAGKVTVEKGATAGTSVRLQGKDLRGVAVDLTAQSDATGAFLFSNLVGGDYQLGYSRTGFEATSSTAFRVASAAAVTAPDVVLRVLRGTVSGTVKLDPGTVVGFAVGTDFSGARVALLDETGAEVDRTVTDASGAFQFRAVAVSLVTGLSHTVNASLDHFKTASAQVQVAANGNTPVGPLTLLLQPGSMTGFAYLNDNVGNSGRNADSTGIAVSVSGVAYNGVTYSKASAGTAANGSWSIADLPPGTFDLHITSTDRACLGGGTFPVRSAVATAAASADCFDTLAPTGLTLVAAPAWTSATSLTLSLASPAVDNTKPTSNLRGYQYVKGRLPDWTAAAIVAQTPAQMIFSLDLNAENTLWVRAVDWLGNAGPASYAVVRQDSVAPATPVIHTPRTYLSATTTSVSLSGAEGDATFDSYLVCSSERPAAVACPALPDCALAKSPASFALSLTAGNRTCLWAQSRDMAGNTSALAGPTPVVCDVSRPGAPSISPVYDPSLYTVRAGSVDVFVAAGPVDAPLGDLNHPYRGVDYLEVDSGGGFVPLCAGCRSATDPNAWDPCSSTCTCADPALRCATVRSGGVSSRELRSINVPLVAGATNRISVRAVDLAGNIGDGASIIVGTEGTRVFAQGIGPQMAPRFYKNMVAYSNNGLASMAQLDARRVPLVTCSPAGEVAQMSFLRSQSCQGMSVAPESLAAIGQLGVYYIAQASTCVTPPCPSSDFKSIKRADLPGIASCMSGLEILGPTKTPGLLSSVQFFESVAVSGPVLAWVVADDWSAQVPDTKSVFWCQLDPTSKACSGAVHPLGAAAGPGHVAGLRAAGDWLFWASEVVSGANCQVGPQPPKYRWRASYVGAARAWTAGAAHAAGDLVWPTTPNGHAYRATSAGTSGATEPAWPVPVLPTASPGSGPTVADGTVVWTEMSWTLDAEQAAISADGKLIFTADNSQELPWTASTLFSAYALVKPTVANGFFYRATQTTGASSFSGRSGLAEPAWPTTMGATVVDNEITWTATVTTDHMAPPAVYRIRSAGPDGLWGTADDPAPAKNQGTREVARGGLAIEPGRAIVLSQTISGSSITDWEAAPDGTFKSDPTGGPSYLRHLSAGGAELSSPEIDHGLFVYAYGMNQTADLVAVDLSSQRWESSVSREDYQTIAEDGTVLVLRNDIVTRWLAVRDPDGSERTTLLADFAGYSGSTPPLAVTGKDVLYQVAGGIKILNAGPDGKLLTADDPAPTVVSLATLCLAALSASEGNAAYFVGPCNGQGGVTSVQSGYALLRPSPGGSLQGVAPVALAAPATGNTLESWSAPAVSANLVAWRERTSSWAQDLRIQTIGGAPPALSATATSFACWRVQASAGLPGSTICDVSGNWPTSGSGLSWQAASGWNLALLISGRLFFYDGGPGGIYLSPFGNTAVGYEVPLGPLVPDTSGGSRNGISFAGNYLALIASSPTQSAQVFLWDKSSQALMQRTTHFSEKRTVQVAPSGRMVWGDTLFASPATFVFLP